MKSLTSILILCLFLVTSLSAQDSKKEERIRSLRIAFLTEKLQLTPQEAEKFWPIYNEYEKERRTLRKDYRKEKKGAELSVVEADAMVDASFELQEKQLKLKRTYYDRMKKVIPSQKLVALDRAEKEFRKKVVEEIKRRKKKERRKSNQ
ncbi:MAG: hypothetical protein ACI8YQ_000169 [Polaribacter sp.]|jgi:hypothetical protein